jgi:ABC-type glycerol-3-phosphate transport system permease component
MTKKFSVTLSRGVILFLLTVCAVVSITPIIWLIAATLKNSSDIFHYTFFPPLSHFTLENYKTLFTDSPFFRYAMNSVFVTCVGVTIQLFFASLAGFALSKYDFKGKKPIMFLMMATMLLPGQLTMAPMYELLHNLHMIDSYWGLLVPSAVNVFGIFLFMQSIGQVPEELLQAARIDGCSEFRIYWDIVMPISKPMIGAFCLISFMGSWNNFLWPQIVLHHTELFTLPIGLNQLVGEYATNYGMLMAGTFLSVVPVMVLFMALQKEFVAGLTSGAVKG